MTPTELDETPKLGRPRDASRDADILDAALEILAETGYDGMTIDQVAARAKAGKATLYRRWPSKAELVLDAVACMKAGELDPENVPDTGTLRGDLVAMIKTPSMRDGEQKLRVMAGVVSMMNAQPDLVDALHAALVEPRAAVNRVIFGRAIARGEIPADADVEMLCVLGPSLVSYQVLMLRKPVDRATLIRNIDRVILPAAFAAAPSGD